MPTITKIDQQKRRPNRRNLFIDGEFAFGCNVNVVARFRLREGMTIDASLCRQIEEGEVQQEAFDHAMCLIGGRMQSERELRTKLGRREYGAAVIDAVIQNLKRLGYLNDEQFARDRAAEQAKVKKVGKRRAVQELRKSGIDQATAERAAAEVYADVDPRVAALELARKKAPALSRFNEITARRRLIGFLQRRGYDYQTVSYAADKALPAKQP